MDSSSANAMNILQQFSQLMFLQSLAASAAGNQSMNPSSMFDFAKLQQPPQQQSSTFYPETKTTTLPPISPQRNSSSDVADPLKTISELLSSHQTLKKELSPASSPTSAEISPFKMYNNFSMDFSSTPYSSTPARQYKVHVNRESAKPLQDWMDSHLANPYPTQKDVQFLSKQTGFTVKQVRNWFTNSRRRYETQAGGKIPWIKKDAPKMFVRTSQIFPSQSSSSEGCESV